MKTVIGVAIVIVVIYLIGEWWNDKVAGPYREELQNLGTAIANAERVRREFNDGYTNFDALDKSINDAKQVRAKAIEQRNFISMDDLKPQIIQAAANVKYWSDEYEKVGRRNRNTNIPDRRGGPPGTQYNENEALGAPDR